MIDAKFIVEKNSLIAEKVFELKLVGEPGKIIPGQFVNIKIPNFFLRRPISVSEVAADGITVIYKVVGNGTAAISSLTAGDNLSVLCGLGNGFTVTEHKKPLLIGGGVGAPPMLYLAKKIFENGVAAEVVLGFRSEKDVFLVDKLAKYTSKVHVATEDGSYGSKGYVTDVVRGLDYDYFYACGPLPMLRALSTLDTDGQLSFEERMGCGFGGCMGCSCKKTDGSYSRICKEGPVFKKGDIDI